MKLSISQNTFWLAILAAASLVVASPLGVIAASDQRLATHSILKAPFIAQSDNISQEQQLHNLEQVYIIMDRLIRANGLDEHPWRMAVIDEYSINAFSTDANLVAIYTGILDQLYGDDAAIAFVLGHELAHHTKRHIAVDSAEEAALRKRLDTEVTAEVDAEIQRLESDAKKYRIALETAKQLCGRGPFGIRIPGCGNLPIPEILQALFNSDGYPDQRKVEARKQAIIAEKTAEYESQTQQLGQKQELEADEIGLQYMTRAGFEPSGSLRTMEVLARVPVPDPEKSSHPDSMHRLKLLKEQIVKNSGTTLIEEGQANLRRSPNPLEVGFSQDGSSLRIESKFGSSKSRSQLK